MTTGDGVTKARVTVSLDAGVADWLRRSAAATGANVSEFVQTLAEQRRAKDEWLARWDQAAGKPDPAMVAAARRQLLGPHADHATPVVPSRDAEAGAPTGGVEARRAS